MELRITNDELKQRRLRVLTDISQYDSGAMVLFNATSIFYLTGFPFIPTERPIALIVYGDGDCVLFGPRLEQEHAEETADVTKIVVYPEYPGEQHPMELLADAISDLNLAGGVLAADAAGYGSGYGYAGPRLEEVLLHTSIKVLPRLVEEHRMIKSLQEIELIRESCKWGNLAHVLLQEYSQCGRREVEVSAAASHEATEMMLKTLGSAYDPRGRVGAMAGFRGQIGPNSALPHAVTRNLELCRGDVLVTGAAASVWGYNSELERTMFVEEASIEQRRWFDLMLRLQDLAFDAIKPGIPCSEVDEIVRRFCDDNALWPNWRHHVGHALGLLGHEAPFFDVGDHTEIKPGMVFSVEPGLYVPGLGGFRHSDTLVVTESGIEMLTYYPRDLESLICR